MTTAITTDDVEGAADLANAVIELLASEAVPPGRAASALAIALGRVCARFGVPETHVVILVREARYVEQEALECS